jgi:hypothetical protein
VSLGDGISVATFLFLVFNFIMQGKGIGKVHKLVNDRATKQDDRIEQLTDALGRSNTAVPPRPHGYA